MNRPVDYPNPFRDLLGKTAREIDDKIEGVYEQLFHGDPATEAFTVQITADSMSIMDFYHVDVRTEGLGLGMMFAVQLDRREDFDRLWRFTERNKLRKTGSTAGYFDSRCDLPRESWTEPQATEECLDPYGLAQVTMALIFAHGRWGDDPGDIDYEAAALDRLELLRRQPNLPLTDDVTATFDSETKLVFHEPKLSSAVVTRPALELTPYFELWAQATGDEFFREAAASGRDFLQLVADPDTALVPARAFFDGTPKPGWDAFGSESYRINYGMVLDRIWTEDGDWAERQTNRLLGFFSSKGLDQYVSDYALDGTPLVATRDDALLAANGASATIATVPDRRAFVEAAWNVATATGEFRYYNGLLQLWSLLILGGRFQVF